ncbi:release factor glutamine methyltransferase [Nitrosomonas sp. Nm51]|uniref:peptide chain release factor N(5)-glutamine methyltransferase n=1 Tax=Nitrosomonas sp. Nm51 TaxID=133720 RepID=UPI0008CEC279|nr:peptide chain release factor N(5)-glutamine methyltransferase [Nitrosomonas sp. Nm51]SER67049.1 release factor glutamine methyltransferase [Nitrosomonas sp. Nm51]
MLNQLLCNQTSTVDSLATVQQVLDWSYRKIERIDARLLLQHVLQVNHAFLITHAETRLTSENAARFLKLVSQREHGVPVAYLTGKREFYDLGFKVSPAVLIPRPETELLVETALAHIPESRPRKILDLGTGSGAIGITIARHRPAACVTAVDISIDAIDIARWNAQKLSVNNIHIVQGDWFDTLDTGAAFDLIVSNPPYVAENDPHLQQGDLRFEPDLALSTQDNGLACIRHIIATAPAYLADGGELLLEHGYDQAAACQQLLQMNGFRKIYSLKDLAGIERVSGGSYCG